MRVITQRDLIRAICQAWEQQYRHECSQDGTARAQTLARLKQLDLETVSADVIDGIIGNNTWTRLTCHECWDYTDWVIQVGEEPDYESQTAQLCLACCRKLCTVVKGNEIPKGSST